MREVKDFKTLHGAHENQIQEEKKKTITAHTWGSPLTSKEKGDKFHKHCMKMM